MSQARTEESVETEQRPGSPARHRDPWSEQYKRLNLLLVRLGPSYAVLLYYYCMLISELKATIIVESNMH